MMRRLFWSCAAVLVVVSAGIYVAGSAAVQYPDSLLGRSVVLAYHLGIDYNPFYAAGQTMAERVGEALRQSHFLQSCSPKCCSRMSSCMEAQHYFPTFRDPGLEREVSDGHQSQLNALPASSMELSTKKMPEECDSAGKVEGCEQIDIDFKLGIPLEQTGAIPASFSVCDDGAGPFKFIPPAEEEVEEEAPATMPYLNNDCPDQAASSLLDVWWGLVRLFKMGEPSHEESEPALTQPQDPPNCQEDPNYHHQYPGCPYHGGGDAGVCPYTGRSYPSCDKPEATPDQGCPVESKPASKPKRKSKQELEDDVKNQTGTGEERRVHPEVDTTDFRPSDAQKGEFDPFPM